MQLRFLSGCVDLTLILLQYPRNDPDRFGPDALRVRLMLRRGITYEEEVTDADSVTHTITQDRGQWTGVPVPSVGSRSWL